VFAGQAWHVAVLLLLYMPISHVQLLRLVLPVGEVDVGGQALHMDEPIVSLYVPVPHSAHCPADVPGPDVPAMH